MLILGMKKNEKILAVNAANPHILVTGITGSGKSLFCQSQLVQRAEEGERVISFNYHKVLSREQMLPEIRRRYDANCKVVRVSEGIALPLFTPLIDAAGREETEAAVTHRICSLLRVAGKLTDAQTRELREAVKYVFARRLYEKEGISAIARKLEDIGSPVALRTLGNLRAVMDSNACVDGNIFDAEERILEFDFDGIEYDDQSAIIRLVCDFVLRLSMTMIFTNAPITIFLDEAQNFSFGIESTMRVLLNEGRKLGVKLLVATPSLVSAGNDFQILNQCGTRVVFRPLNNEIKQLADELDRCRRAYLLCELPELKVGEFMCAVASKQTGERRSFSVLRTYIPGKDYQEALS